MIARAAQKGIEEISDAQLGEFKTVVTRCLTPHASAVLIDPEYGHDACSARAENCGLLMTYEMDGFENPRPHKALALLPRLSVYRLCELGADGVKILLTYSPLDDESANDEKHAMLERIGHECEAAGLPFFLEPVGYDPRGVDVKSQEYAREKPDIVTRMVEEFSRDRYKVDVLKVEFPVTPAYIGAAYSHQEALDIFRRVDSVARRPYIYLSAGVSSEEFLGSLRLAEEAGVRYSGVLCGRATWQDGVPQYASGGMDALVQWLETDGTRNIQAINERLRSATPWTQWYQT